MIISKLREKREDHWASGTDSKKGRARYTNVPVNLWETLRASYEARAQAWNLYGAKVSTGNRDLDCSVVGDKSAREQVFKEGLNNGVSKGLNLLGNHEVTSLFMRELQASNANNDPLYSFASGLSHPKKCGGEIRGGAKPRGRINCLKSLLMYTQLGFGVKTTFWHLDLGFSLTSSNGANQLIKGLYPAYT